MASNSTAQRSAPVVAELGRPETLQETAERKAQASKDHRERQTARNLVYALIVTVALAIAGVLMGPSLVTGTTSAQNVNVDYTSVAKQGDGAEPEALLVPHVPTTWRSNSAQLRPKYSDGVDEWYVGLITPSNGYIGLTQGFDADASWLADQVAHTRSTGSTTIDGIVWTIYDNRTSSGDVGDAKYALTTTQGKSTVVVFGTASTAQIREVAASLTSQLAQDGESTK